MATVRTLEFAHLLGRWASSDGPAYQRLAAAIRQAVERGELSRGVRLPAERNLARVLGVSRTTVVAALDVLRTQGCVESRQGSGTRIRGGQVSRGSETDAA